MKRPCILLSACVNPNGMAYTVLQDAEIRKKQYIESLTYYLHNTNVPVVFCENTLCDFSAIFQDYIRSGRLEYLTFNGNDYDKKRGKGYGEALIIKYAYEHSEIIVSSNYIIKITGRIKVKNIESIVNQSILNHFCFFRSDFRLIDYIHSQLFVVSTSLLLEIINEGIDTLNDSNNVYFEHIIYQGLLNRPRVIVIPFFKPTLIDGICGTSNTPYPNRSFKDNILINSYIVARLNQLRKCYYAFLFWGFIYKLLYYYSRCMDRS